MTDKGKVLLKKARILCIVTTAGIIILSLESLITHQNLFMNYALGLATGGLILITLIIWRIVKLEE